ncbi:S-methyl-5-thioribose-1-phosphate isomerase [Arcobacter sp. LA11]|uniref:S-methyl-5-thioribose-1-phosphate isomerase n=1 Tax=Arcobacter sp. LA11 TaxID=1898176 RepID=UPI0009342F6C|nr:S-methyl-5-thioribose-1-phosphate isomerase [Arcobacter sp. LA11]
MNGKYKAFWLNENGFVEVIDQTKLPFIEETVVLKNADDAIVSIKDMIVRGAGVIGNIGALGVYLAVKENQDLKFIVEKSKEIRESRPTAVNLMWAVDIMLEAILNINENEDLLEVAKSAAIKICDEDSQRSSLIAKYGCDIFEDIMNKKGKKSINVLTHCNAGWLAIVDDGSALAPIYEAKRRGIDIHVYVDETRPRNQGANLTAWELGQDDIEHTIIPDNTGGYLMQQGLVDVCIVGADRVSANGDVANKIGTYLKALAAKDNDIPFYVAIPEGTLDFEIKDGVKDIPIETRSEDEVKYIKGLNKNGEVEELLITPKNSKAVNYGFDITPARLVTGLITEKGLCDTNEKSIYNKFIN